MGLPPYSTGWFVENPRIPMDDENRATPMTMATHLTIQRDHGIYTDVQ